MPYVKRRKEKESKVAQDFNPAPSIPSCGFFLLCRSECSNSAMLSLLKWVWQAHITAPRCQEPMTCCLLWAPTVPSQLRARKTG